jgi:hypothetical protein
MSKSKPSLAAAIHNIQPQKPAPVASIQDEAAETRKKKTPLVLSVEAHIQLKRLAVDHNRTLHDVLMEAVNDMFLKHKLPPIA